MIGSRSFAGEVRSHNGTALGHAAAPHWLFHGRVVARVRELGLEHRIALPGYVAYADVPNVYPRHDLFVSPTYAEGFSNTILEAMASGLPVLSTRAVGVVDCVRP